MARPVLLLVLLAVALAPVLAANDSLSVASTTLDIFFVNDLRYQLFPTTSQSSEELCKGDVTKCFGGLPGLNDLRAKQKDAVWLHAGLGLGHAAGATDYYRLLKHGAGVEALNTLAFNAMSVDADMFRFGKGAEVVTKLSAKTKLTCANCEKGLTGAELQAFQRFTPTGSSCDVVVIGVISKNSTLEYLPTVAVTDEVQAVQDAVKKAQAANSAAALYVVVGEMEAATAEQVLALDGVGVVLSSGTVAVGSAVVSKVSDKKDKVSSTVPEEAALAMSVGQLSLTLDDKCTPTNVQPAATQTYRNDLTKTDPTVAKMVQDVLTEVTETVKLNVASSRELSGDLDPCGFMMCAVGQMAADGVHALLDGATETESTAVIIPAGAFQGTLPTAFNWTTLLGIAPNDPFFCRNSISGELLYALLVDMLAAQTTFPQVSGLLIDIWPGDNGVDVVNVWTRSAGLSAQLVPKDATVNVTVAMPCLAMQSSARFVEDAEVTSVVLSEGMRRSLVAAATSTAPSTAPSTLALPPLMEARIRLQVPTATRLGCEDWVGMTVTYTLLVLGGIAMVAFQGYQLWRFRTTLSYIR